MALDAQGRPIPVYVPPLGPLPLPNPPDHVSPHPDIENDVGLLKGAVKDLSIRLIAIERFASDVAKLSARVAALEESVADFAQRLAMFALVEEAFEEMPKLLARISLLETFVAKGEKQYAITLSRLDSVEKQLFAAVEAGHVDAIPPA